MCQCRFNGKRTILFLAVFLTALFLGFSVSKSWRIFTRPSIPVEIKKQETVEKVEIKPEQDSNTYAPCERILLPSEKDLKEKPTSKTRRTVNGGVLNHRTCLASPQFPKEAIEQKVFGKVEVEVLMDENGYVLNARAISGETLLRKAAVEAAYKSKSGPTLLGGKSVKVKGILIFDFPNQF